MKSRDNLSDKFWLKIILVLIPFCDDLDKEANKTDDKRINLWADKQGNLRRTTWFDKNIRFKLQDFFNRSSPNQRDKLLNAAIVGTAEVVKTRLQIILTSSDIKTLYTCPTTRGGGLVLRTKNYLVTKIPKEIEFRLLGDSLKTIYGEKFSSLVTDLNTLKDQFKTKAKIEGVWYTKAEDFVTSWDTTTDASDHNYL